MTAARFFAIIVILAAAGLAWAILGSTLEYRSADLGTSLAEEVDNLWGPCDLVQGAAYAAGQSGGAPRNPSASAVEVTFQHENRYKGLLWFSTYTVGFRGRFTFDSGDPGGSVIRFPLPSPVKVLEDLTIDLDGQAHEAVYSSAVPNSLELPADGTGTHVLTVSYRTRGRNSWRYAPAPGRDSVHLRDFRLVARTNFRRIDYPKGTASPVTPAKPTDGGMEAVWQYDNVRSNQTMGILMPCRQNAGPMAARMSFFAPVSLLFFFTVLFTVMILLKIPLHPMHYLFVSGGFFAFHILLAYLVDLIPIQPAFWVCAVVSVFLVVSYMRLVAGVKFALTYVALAQLAYLVGFSYAFFWEGRTGLTVTIGAIVTLFVLMQATGRVNWNEVFRKAPPPFPPLRPAQTFPATSPPAGTAPDPGSRGPGRT